MQAVAAKAVRAASALKPADRELLVIAAWLHDVGYAEQLAATGFHSLDGAQWLRQQGHERVACLVAHHSCASFEAALRGLSEVMATYPDEGTAVRDLLTYCDMTTGPAGQAMTLDERLADVRKRYGTDGVVTRALQAAEGELSRQLTAAERLLADAQPM
nr:HD domain-containing protein [Kineococcus sp. TRM81007]